MKEARRRYGGGANAAPNQRWTDIWSVGHSVSGVRAVPTVAELVDALVQEYRGGTATEARSTQRSPTRALRCGDHPGTPVPGGTDAGPATRRPGAVRPSVIT